MPRGPPAVVVPARAAGIGWKTWMGAPRVSASSGRKVSPTGCAHAADQFSTACSSTSASSVVRGAVLRWYPAISSERRSSGVMVASVGSAFTARR
ncbi:hypothetical protein [Streptomyces sp. MBT53]|uniref:hypothetical protein n=1 Tax=Streptomyces sp. MBT53 TaxID=1488384 RepID=UPI001913C488|nr:hypothetical protein [Streptomyces sp. MBT53]MBK6019138.1 hypothetical protein [Streptomyces sp. MBT53]